MTKSTAVYRAAARWLSRTFLNTDPVLSVFARRSVAAGEAVFPWSDLDLAILIRPATGVQLYQLRRRYRMARLAFPRLGECLVFTQADLQELTQTDPYRVSLDRRCLLTTLGEEPALARAPIPMHEAARRLVFWFESYIPRALAQGNLRNLRKYALEMANALGVIEGHWAEPLGSRLETARRTGPVEGDPLAACFRAAARAHALLRPPAPALSRARELPGMVLVPSAREAPRTGVRAVTPEVLDLLMETQNPLLWQAHEHALQELGFRPPSREAWLRAAHRWSGGEKVRSPGFFEHGTERAAARLRDAAAVLGDTPPSVPAGLSVQRYYLAYYEELDGFAASLRGKAKALTRE